MTDNMSTYHVRVVLNNNEKIAQDFLGIVSTASQDEAQSIDSAARRLQAYVRELDPDAEGCSDLRKVDYDLVDYRTLIVDELEEKH